MAGIIANIFGSQFWESIWDSLGKNGSFYFDKTYFQQSMQLWGACIVLLIEKGTPHQPSTASHTNSVDQQGDIGLQQITSKPNGLVTFIPN